MVAVAFMLKEHRSLQGIVNTPRFRTVDPLFSAMYLYLKEHFRSGSIFLALVCYRIMYDGKSRSRHVKQGDEK